MRALKRLFKVRSLFSYCSCLVLTDTQSPAVSGEINLTCDAWQANNTDAYFAVTGHWIEERAPGEWTLQQALLGFSRINTSHDGERLGRALFNVCSRLQIVPKVCIDGFQDLFNLTRHHAQVRHITCDNAKNNNTMLEHFALHYWSKTGKTFDVNRQYIRYVSYHLRCCSGTEQ